MAVNYRRCCVSVNFDGACQAILRVVVIRGRDGVISRRNRLGCAVSGSVIGENGPPTARFGYGSQTVQRVVGVSRRAVCAAVDSLEFRKLISRAVVGVFVEVYLRAVCAAVRQRPKPPVREVCVG